MAENTIKSDYFLLCAELAVIRTDIWYGIIFVGRRATIKTDEWIGVDGTFDRITVKTDKYEIVFTPPEPVVTIRGFHAGTEGILVIASA